ncbi:kinase-like protein [Paxillus ammoniavirescens]|nr:kinase-like protein [Paxillus ammoniavirescens]
MTVLCNIVTVRRLQVYFSYYSFPPLVRFTHRLQSIFISPAKPLLRDTSSATNIDIDESWNSSFPVKVFSAESLERCDDYPSNYGGLGDIWRCRLRKESEVLVVAVKVVRLHSVREEITREKSKILLREASVWAQLSHKNILPLYGVTYEFGQLPSLVSSWTSNGSLEQFLGANDHLPMPQKIDMASQLRLLVHLILTSLQLTQIADGLEYLHSKDIVHGDLTNTSVLINDNGDPCIADFGLSSMLLEEEVPYSNMIGNIRWAAPELFEDRPGQSVQPTVTSDLYSYGWIMFRILTGRPPYHWLTSAAAVLAAKIRPQDPLQWDPNNTQLPEVCMKLIEDSCSFDPAVRPSLATSRDTLLGLLVA